MALKGKNAFVSVSCFTSGQSGSEVLERSLASPCVMLFTPLLPILVLLRFEETLMWESS